MAKHKPEIHEYMGQFDDGTYQTGAIRPPKPGNSLVVFLLVLVILLGGLCSAMGIINVQLLAQLSQTHRETTPLSMDSHPNLLEPDNYLEGLDLPLPQVPQVSSLALQLVESPCYSAEASGSTNQEIFENNRDCLVDVQCLTHFGAVQTGIGLVLTSDGFLLTNHHIVDAAKRIFVTLPDGTLLRAALVGSDSFSDLAVLYVDAQALTPAEFSGNQTLQVADPSLAVEAGTDGYMLRQSTIFSVLRTFSTKSNSLNLIQTCSGGNAGPVYNAFGHVIGFQVGHISQYFSNADTKGTGLVIPSNTISQIVSTLVTQGSMDGRPSLGIEVEAISKVYQQYWQLPDGLLLTQVLEDSNAHLCGLEEGDILLALDGVPIKSRSDLYTTLYNHHIGDTVIAVINRDDKTFTVKLTVEDNAQQ